MKKYFTTKNLYACLTNTSMIVALCYFIIVLGSCVSHEQKQDDAFEIVKKEKNALKESNFLKPEIVKEQKETQIGEKNRNIDEWTKFENEMDKKILANEHKVKELKGNANISARLSRKVENLEKDNNALRKKINEYKEKMRVSLESFKVGMDHEVNVIGIELKDIAINGKKQNHI
ncbi:MAG: hypothetical protein NTU44_06840 [Bacteroidetes bacterium]|nr:hypothetical protein [Bacteroidota bacterium]